MRFLTRSLMGLFLLALTVGLLAMGGFSIFQAMQARNAENGRAPTARERVFAANVIPVTFKTMSPVLTAYGEVRSTRELELRASAAGTIVELAPDFEDGAEVEKGELLVKLDPAEAQAARDSAAATVAEAEAALAQAERALAISKDDVIAAQRQADLRLKALDRQRSLSERGVGSAANLETSELAASAADQAVLNRRSALSTAQAQLDTARTSLTRAKISLTEADRKLADTEIRAEFSGRLAEVNAVAGGLVSNNEMLGKLIDPNALEIAFRVSTAQFARLTDDRGALRDLPVGVELVAGEETLTAKAELSRVSAAVDDGVTGRLLFARVTDGLGNLRPGDFVTVRLKEPALENVAEIPAAAVDAESTVLVLGPEDRLETADVTVLRRQGDAVIIRAKFAPGTEIVAERTPLLGRGIKLRPMRPGQPQAATEPETINLDPERRAKLVSFVETNTAMPDNAKQRFLAELKQDEVPVATVEKLESRIGG
ncbi:efflux RND transporter periplasmic adaptor subunit [Thioclava sp. F36-7]|uniref:efflux RND transporter periplasmic adaptor subunit n=1 Tax=Thioclava sp. F36-7 TaxID=1915317 RepID=UPI000997D54F|nr:efflux RND transporter periplasmic adaptor subunit [Thioclava sp. F36-7]OOY07956.1 efflux transporter periplasmic adaptor subunit [Thioclava sp. F36-7]